MFSFFVGITLAVHLGPIFPDASAREPQMAVDGSTIVLAFGAGKGIYFSASGDSGSTFSAPVKVAEAAILPLTRHRGPRIASTGHTIVISAVVGRTLTEGPHAHDLPSDGDLIAWRSNDGGRSWSNGVVVNDVPGAPTEGLHALAADAKGNFFAAWLDKRGAHGTKLYGARSTDGDRQGYALYWTVERAQSQGDFGGAYLVGPGRARTIFMSLILIILVVLLLLGGGGGYYYGGPRIGGGIGGLLLLILILYLLFGNRA